MDLNEARGQVEYLDACLRDIAERGLPEEQEAFDAGLAARDDIAKTIERHQRIADLAALPGHTEVPSGPQVIRKADPRDVMEDRSARPIQLADAVTRSLEDRVEPEQADAARQILRRHLSDSDGIGVETDNWARSLIGRMQPEYVSGFKKYMAGRTDFWSAEERAAMAVGTNTAGGFLVPTHLDASLIFTNSGTSNAVRGISRVVTLTEGNVWNGVTTAGSTFSVDGELVEVSDDTPAVARVSIPVYKCQGLVQASIEAFEDIAALASDVLEIFADGRDRLEGQLHCVGTGSGPQGIFTALDANTNVEIVATTAATFSLADLQKVYRNVPVRFRSNSTWLMNPLYLGSIQALGTALGASYTTNLSEAYASRLLGRPVVESDDAPNTVTTTANDNQLVLGDFRNFVIVDKPGSMSIEFIPHLFNTSSNLPDGRRGWYLHWRTGSDSVVDTAFRLYQSKTSA